MKKYIDADLCEQYFYEHMDDKAMEIAMLAIDDMPAADVAEVVRCRECVMWDDSFVLNGKKRCLNIGFCTDGDFYCGWGHQWR